MKRLVTLMTTAALSLTAADAKMLDFEDFGVTNGDLATVVGTEFESEYGIVFSSNDGLRIIEVGGSQDGFAPNDTPNPADAFGQFFLGTAFDDGYTELTIEYTEGVEGLSFDLGDIDGPEVFQIDVLGMGDEMLFSRTIRAGDAGTGDRSVYKFGASGLSGLVHKVVLTGERERGRLGIAFDNFSVDSNMNAVPVPGAFPLFFGAALAAGALNRSRRKRG
ncbi:MAG: hypothetical protein AAFR65_14865 [Pseudomonadota bacterium]